MKKKLLVFFVAGALGMAGCSSVNAESVSGQGTENEVYGEKQAGDAFYEVTASNDMYAGMSAKDTAMAVLDYINENVNCINSYMYNSGFGCDRYEQYNYVDGKYFFQSKTVEDEGGVLYELLADPNYVHESNYWFDDWTNYYIDKRYYLEDEGNKGSLTARTMSNDSYKSQHTQQGMLLWLAEMCNDSDITRRDEGDTIIISAAYQGYTNIYKIRNGMIVSLSDEDNVVNMTFNYYKMPEGRYDQVINLYQNGTGKTEEEVDNVLDFKQKE